MRLLQNVHKRIDNPAGQGLYLGSRKHGALCVNPARTTFKKRPCEAEKVGVKHTIMPASLAERKVFLYRPTLND
jgi:hypothetical protein